MKNSCNKAYHVDGKTYVIIDGKVVELQLTMGNTDPRFNKFQNLYDDQNKFHLYVPYVSIMGLTMNRGDLVV